MLTLRIIWWTSSHIRDHLRSRFWRRPIICAPEIRYITSGLWGLKNWIPVVNTSDVYDRSRKNGQQIKYKNKSFEELLDESSMTTQTNRDQSLFFRFTNETHTIALLVSLVIHCILTRKRCVVIMLFRSFVLHRGRLVFGEFRLCRREHLHVLRFLIDDQNKF